jgi:hypothetical protein
VRAATVVLTPLRSLQAASLRDPVRAEPSDIASEINQYARGEQVRVGQRKFIFNAMVGESRAV